MTKNHVAHITTINGQRIEQSVKEHSLNTANYAGAQLKSVGLYYTAYLSGLIHDMGKLTHKFEQYIEDVYSGKDVARGSVNHTFAAVIYLFEKFHINRQQIFDKLTCEIIAFASGSHHGEFDCVDTDSKSGFEHRIFKDKTEICYDETVNNFFAECADEKEIERLFGLARDEITGMFQKMRIDFNSSKQKVSFLVGMIARMVLSAVIEGDRRDTAEFMSGKKNDKIEATRELWKKQLDFLDHKLKGFTADSPINRARSYISDRCKNHAKQGSGIYKITVPTGAGKTLSTLRYALAHAKEHKKSRVIFIIPLLSVLEQNSKVIRDYITDESLITEHHSNVVKPLEMEEQLDKYELLSETWDAPIIISTLVQLLNMLFSHKTSAIRRMCSLADCVIVIDEVQSLPRNITDMFNMAINFISYYCNATVVLSSATQPCFEQANMPLKLSEAPEMVPYNEYIFKVFKRTVIIDKTTPYGMTTEELADFSLKIMDNHSSLLVICNTKTTAQNLYCKIKSLNCEYKLFHLSTSMCMKHRIDTLEEINEGLDKKQKIICVSTQLVEAGVDFSFESVIRIKAGMDNIAQAAGRCNRNNDFNRICNVFIVNLKDENLAMLKDIKISQDCTTELLNAYSEFPQKFGNDLLSDSSISEYYRILFNRPDIKNLFKYPIKNKLGDTDYMFDLLADNGKYTQRQEYTGRYFLNQSFKTAGKNFKVFEDNTTDIIVPYNKEAEEIIANLCSEKAKFDLGYMKEKIASAKMYTIQVFEYQRKKLKEYGMLISDEGEHFIALNPQCYNRKIGLDIENKLCEGRNYYDA
jgi:CRISPR-associated endonuclease/helicase Cas3